MGRSRRVGQGTIDWFKHLDRARWAPSLITTQPSSNRWLHKVEPYADEVWALPDLMPGAAFPAFILGFIESRGIEVVHIMNSRIAYDLMPDMTCLRNPPAIVLQFHAEEPDRAGYARYAAARYGNLVDAFSVTSHQLGAAMREYDIAASRIHVIHSGVDAEQEFDPASVEPFDDLPGDGPRVLWPGRLVEQKDPMLTLEVLRLLKQRGVGLTLHVVGDGPLEHEVRSRAREVGVAGMIAWHPSSLEMARWYRSCDLLLMTSVFEGVPYVIYEALAMGMPVVAPALPGNVEFMDADSGVLVEPRDDAAQYADAVAGLLADARAPRGDRRPLARAHAARLLPRRDGRSTTCGLYDDLLASRTAALHSRREAIEQPLPAVAAPIAPLRLEREPAPERSVAVIVPCYQHGRYLPECIASIHAQTLSAAQIIVVDDCSEDGETDAALDALEDDPAVTVIRMDVNSGPSAARNRALREVDAAYVLPLDADDLLLPGALADMVAQLESAPADIGFVYPNPQHFGNRNDYVQSPVYNLHLLLQDNYCPATSLFDRRVFDAGVAYDEEIVFGHEDWDVVLQLAELGIRGEVAAGPTFKYRRRGFSRVNAVEYGPESFHEDDRAPSPRALRAGRARSDQGALGARPVDRAAGRRRRRVGRRRRGAAGRPELRGLRGHLPRRARRARHPRAGPRARRRRRGLARGGGLDRARPLGARGDTSGRPRVRPPLVRRAHAAGVLGERRGRGRRADRGAGAAPRLVLADRGARRRRAGGGGLGAVARGAGRGRGGARRDRLARRGRAHDGPDARARAVALAAAAARGRRRAGARPLGGGDAVRMPLGIAPAQAPAEALVRRSLAWQPPALPGLTPGTVRRWKGTATWQPPESVVLSRHRAVDRPHWIVTNRRDPPDGYVLEFDLGLVQQHEQPGTRRLVSAPGGFALRDAVDPLEPGARPLGHVEQSPFPMMDLLELRRMPATGQAVLVAGPEDPLYELADPVAVLGYLESFPIQPRRLVRKPLPPWSLTLLVRTTEHANWRHVYDSAEFGARDAGDPSTLALGSIWTHPAPGFVQLRRDAAGRITSDIHTPSADAPGHPAGTVPRWVAAPLRWSGRPRPWALRAAASRARHVAAEAARRTAPGPGARALGFIRASSAPGYSPLYSARHPVLADQFVTRSALEARDMGYRIEGLLGHIGDLGAERHRGPREILWSSRFGRERRYVEG